MFSRFDRTLACDGQTDGRTDIMPQRSPRYAFASRGKNAGSHIWTKVLDLGVAASTGSVQRLASNNNKNTYSMCREKYTVFENISGELIRRNGSQTPI